MMIGLGVASASAFAFAEPIGLEVRHNQSHRDLNNPVERFGLGRDGTIVSSGNRTTHGQPVLHYAAVEVGTYRGGKRVLVPFEPARKRDRMRERAHNEQAQWRYDDYGDQSASSDSDERWAVSDRYDNVVVHRPDTPRNGMRNNIAKVPDESTGSDARDGKDAIRKTAARVQAIASSTALPQRAMDQAMSTAAIPDRLQHNGGETFQPAATQQVAQPSM